ncbi:MAG TPA: hypothetical protein PKI66_02140 [Methanobacteriaceae archaeon]|nr:hypothetical protein [Methanobacteriaceae archaeon]
MACKSCADNVTANSSNIISNKCCFNTMPPLSSKSVEQLEFLTQ